MPVFELESGSDHRPGLEAALNSEEPGGSFWVIPVTVQYVTDEKGERQAVMLTLEDYERMVEDLADLAVAAERRDEPAIEHHEFIEELKRDGLLPGAESEGECDKRMSDRRMSDRRMGTDEWGLTNGDRRMGTDE